MLETLGNWIGRAADTAVYEMGVVFRFATQSPAAFATFAALVVALLVMIALARK